MLSQRPCHQASALRSPSPSSQRGSCGVRMGQTRTLPTAGRSRDLCTDAPSRAPWSPHRRGIRFEYHRRYQLLFTAPTSGPRALRVSCSTRPCLHSSHQGPEFQSSSTSPPCGAFMAIRFLPWALCSSLFILLLQGRDGLLSLSYNTKCSGLFLLFGFPLFPFVLCMFPAGRSNSESHSHSR